MGFTNGALPLLLVLPRPHVFCKRSCRASPQRKPFYPFVLQQPLCTPEHPALEMSLFAIHTKHTGLQTVQIWLSAVSAIGIWRVAGPAAWSFVLTMANPDSVAFYPLWQLCRQKGWGKGKASRRNSSSQFHMSFRSAIMSILWMEAETKRDKVTWPGSQGISGTELRKEQAPN